MKRFIFAITVLVFAFASLSVAKPAKAKASPKPARTAAKAVKKSEVKDARDGQVYRVVNIAGLTWMGDNLNYNAEGSFCLDDDENNCMAYGRLYSWDVAQKACPAGFRVPTHADFEKLWTAAGADFNAGYLLKTNYGWKGDTNGNDTLKFSAMPAGNRFDDGTYGNLAKFAFFWTADDTSEDIPAGEARVWYLTNKSMAFGYTAKSKKFAFSLRCVK
ncbi:major paralogous domain-containing protein [Fibrobacter sp. UWCM]|uniref:fibrobacter succinogenes major paralogous domain-containing protein n=1 Tax=Fibrobacter sp. UWCM TaxID=1896208 RepID=UPI000913A272|nr:fibrobacter succinogenes major paralogous domain-containing protein [Fibrobacter sp. UWCM]SHG35663.1 major paralogous domain-containing protein [Fibrobacter sp. UWCM]